MNEISTTNENTATQSPYLNRATEALIVELQNALLVNNDGSAGDRPLKAFRRFVETCRIEPAIVKFVRRRKARRLNGPTFQARELQIMMLGMIARSSSTYGTIPNVVAHLALIGEHAGAAILNENAKNETGDRDHAPHPTLLYDCFKVIGETLQVTYLTPASYHILRQVLIGRGSTTSSLRDKDSVISYLNEKEVHLPEYSKDDIEVAIQYSELCSADVSYLHSLIVQAESRMNDRTDDTSARDPYDKQWIATRLLELAMREASSVDDHDSGQLSYIGAWGEVVETIVPQIPQDCHERARAWVEAHNDEVAGQAVGWEGAAEEGHAEDARIQALQVLGTLKPDTFAAVLDEVTSFNRARLDFWDDIVCELAAA